MPKKVIQVPMDEDLLKELDRVARSTSRARADLIREACREHLRGLEREEMDRRYREGYEKFPESGEWGELGGMMMADIHEKEPW